MQAIQNKPPLVVHVIFRLAIGGMENGLVNLINRMPASRYRHAIVCMSDYTDFRERIQRDDVEVYALRKKPGHDLAAYWRFWKYIRKMKPAIVHTRNLGALEFQVPAMLAGVRHRIQSEHGRDVTDLQGNRKKYLHFRRLINPFVNKHIALSKDLQHWLEQQVGIHRQHVDQIYNGVDTDVFSPVSTRTALPAKDFATDNSIIIGTIGRMQGEKDQLTLVRAFIQLLNRVECGRDRLRLVMIGDGPLFQEALDLLRQANAEQMAWLPGSRSDAPQLLKALDIFVLPSLIEGISNTILEAMATGLPVVATAVGGNPELVEEGITGKLVPSANPDLMADAIQKYVDSGELRQVHGKAGRERVEQHFSMENMVQGYMDVYDRLLHRDSSRIGNESSVLHETLDENLQEKLKE